MPPVARGMNSCKNQFLPAAAQNASCQSTASPLKDSYFSPYSLKWWVEEKWHVKWLKEQTKWIERKVDNNRSFSLTVCFFLKKTSEWEPSALCCTVRSKVILVAFDPPQLTASSANQLWSLCCHFWPLNTAADLRKTSALPQSLPLISCSQLSSSRYSDQMLLLPPLSKVSFSLSAAHYSPLHHTFFFFLCTFETVESLAVSRSHMSALAGFFFISLCTQVILSICPQLNQLFLFHVYLVFSHSALAFYAGC